VSKTDTFHIRWRGRVTGPFSWSELEQKLDTHEIGLLHDVQFNNAWTTLGDLLTQRGEVVRINAAHSVAATPTGEDLRTGALPPPLPTKRPAPDRRIFVALAIVAGFLGAHDFYAHHWIRGGLLLGIALLLWRLDWGIIWPWIWALGEIIVTKVDGHGRRMPWKRKS
jgi:TM2 domain-containing membrane protein YozV